MEISVNQQHYQLNGPCSVEEMLTIVKAPSKGIAVAVNQTIVSKPDWPVHVLKHGDQIMLIKATQGG